MGGLVQNPNYQAVRLEALNKLVGWGSDLPKPKKMALRRMLIEVKQRGFADGGKLDLSGFLKLNAGLTPEPNPA